MSEVPDRIVVSKDKLVRCKWCGSPQSNEWVVSEKRVIYCTTECMNAANVGKAKLSAYATLLCSFLLIIPYFLAFISGSFGVLWFGFEFLIYGVCFLIAGLAGLATMNEGKKYQDRKGKYGGFPPIECEYCRHANPPNATRCLNCDAALTRAPFSSEVIPPWISKYKKVSGTKCPHCSAIYSYSPSMISEEKQVACQNCNRQFSVPILSRDSSSDSQRAMY